MQLTATHINYFFICRRKLWLFSNGINMEHTSQAVAEGKLIGETTYPQRPEKYTEVEIAGSKIDFYDAKAKVVHEIKKSDKMETAHQWQVKFYIWLLEQNGIDGATGILEYPSLREKTEVLLTGDDRATLVNTVKEIEALVQKEECPARINAKICKSCSYHDFCYIDD
jgi:CRISPR-associated exonuclease Cas4